MSTERIKIQYLNDEIEKLCYIDGKSDCIDLRAADYIGCRSGKKGNGRICADGFYE